MAYFWILKAAWVRRSYLLLLTRCPQTTPAAGADSGLYTDEVPPRTAIYHISLEPGSWDAPELTVTWKEGWTATDRYPRSSVRQSTELLEQMGWGRWVERLGELTPATLS